jgi:hypothetical protein
MTACVIQAQTPLANGDFESLPFATGWQNTGALSTDGFAPGSSTAARFTTTGQYLRQTASWGSDWHVDFWFMVQETTDRQFSFIAETANAISTINLRYQDGWFAYAGGSWGTALTDLGNVIASVDANNDGDVDDIGDTRNVYHMRITGHDWGAPAARYDLALSEANGTAFSTTLVGLTRYQSAAPTTVRPNAIKFGTEFGGNPGFWLDDITTHDDEPQLTLPVIHYFVAETNPIALGEDTVLSWSTTHATSLVLLPGDIDVSHTNRLIVSPTSTQNYMLVANNGQAAITNAFTVGVDETFVPPQINEFLTAHTDGLRDEDGNTSDWIELFNPNPFSLNLHQWTVSDTALNLERWTFPETSIAPQDYLIVFASGKNRVAPGQPLHTNFSLNDDGEYLALGDEHGTVIDGFIPTYPAQFPGVSYGRNATNGFSFFGIPSPGTTNIPSPYITDYLATPQTNGSIRISVLAGTSTTGSLSQVTLYYRTMYQPEVSVPLSPLGSGMFEATIPAGISSPGEMVRWRLAAGESGIGTNTLPAFNDLLQSPEYFGTVNTDTNLSSALPVFEWFVAPGMESAADTRAGTRCSVFWRGTLYDNILVHLRGASTAVLEKKPHQFEFNPGHLVRLKEGSQKVDQLNINAAYPDASYMRDILPMENMHNMGIPAPEVFPIRVQQNGAFHSLGILIEQPDKDFLSRHDTLLDPQGVLYKATGNGSWLASSSGFEARNGANLVALDQFTAALNSTNQLEVLLEQVDLPSVVNYLAVNVVDSIYNPQKNYYVHQNRFGEWMFLPWDRDFSYGHRWLGGGDPRGPAGPTRFLVTDERIEWGGSDDDFKGGYNRLFDAIYAHATTREMFYRRLRTIIDTVLAPNVLENRIDELRTVMKPEADLDRAAWGFTSNGSYSQFPQEPFDAALERIKTVYLPARRTFLEVNGGAPARGILPNSQVPLLPIQFGQILSNPPSGHQDDEFIELMNTNTVAVDLSNWTISGGITHTVRPGTVIPGGQSLFLSPDVQLFRSSSNQAVFAQGNYKGHLSNFGETLTLMDASSNLITSITTPYSPNTNQLYLRISEIMYHPAAPHPDAEFIEFVNLSTNLTLDLSGVTISDGVDYIFPPGSMLATHQRVLVVLNQIAFENAYTNGLPISGEFSNNRLSNRSDTIKVDDADGSTIETVTYTDALPWPLTADGLGHSLVFIGGDSSNPSQWRSSVALGGTPGDTDAIPYPGGDLITYALAIAPELNYENKTLSVQRNPGADDVDIIPQWSADLITWQEDQFSFQGSGPTTWRFAADGHRLYLRLALRLR